MGVFLLTNPGAEANNLGGWTVNGGTWSTPSSVNVAGIVTTAPVGGRFFRSSGATGTLYQDVDLTTQHAAAELDAGGVFCEFRALIANLEILDHGRINLEFLDGAAASLSINHTDFQAYAPTGEWVEVVVRVYAPPGARTARLRFDVQAVVGAGSANIGFDEARFETLDPTVQSVAVLGAETVLGASAAQTTVAGLSVEAVLGSSPARANVAALAVEAVIGPPLAVSRVAGLAAETVLGASGTRVTVAALGVEVVLREPRPSTRTRPQILG